MSEPTTVATAEDKPNCAPVPGYVSVVVKRTLLQFLAIDMMILHVKQSDDHRLIPMICAAVSALIFLAAANCIKTHNEKVSEVAGRKPETV